MKSQRLLGNVTALPGPPLMASAGPFSKGSSALYEDKKTHLSLVCKMRNTVILTPSERYLCICAILSDVLCTGTTKPKKI